MDNGQNNILLKFRFFYRLEPSTQHGGADKTKQGCRNSGHQVAVTTKFFKVAPHICRSSINVILQAPRIAR